MVYRQLNVRITDSLYNDILDLARSRGYYQSNLVIDMLKLGIILYTNTAVKEQMDKLINDAKITQDTKPDYVALLLAQFEEIKKAEKLKNVEEPLTSFTINPNALLTFTENEK